MGVTIDLRGVLIQKVGTFARIIHSIELAWAAYSSDKRTA
jgi:hypothetical protein